MFFWLIHKVLGFHHGHVIPNREEFDYYPCGGVRLVWRTLECCECGREYRQVFPY